MSKRVLFLNPPSFEGFDGGAGSRYQAKREIRSYWYPTWLAQAAALCPGSRVLDAPAEEMSVEDTVRMVKDFDILVIFTSTAGYHNDAGLVRRFKQECPGVLVGMVGPHVTALPEDSLRGCEDLDFVARKEFDYTILDIAQEKRLSEVEGISYPTNNTVVHNKDRDPIEDLDSLPTVLDVYERDLQVENYFVGYLLHPFLSVYTGRGCAAKCTFCLWPQTIAGNTYRVRSPKSVIDEIARAKEMFPQVKEFFFDDDTFTSKFRRAEEIARGLKKLNITWSCSARVTVPEKTLQIMKDSGLRLLMVGIESGSDEILKNIKKGITTDQCRRFIKTCKELGIVTHATFVVGLPGETKETINQTIEFAKELDPDTLQVSIATPYPGTEFYRQALDNNWFIDSTLVSCSGVQEVSHEYEDLTKEEIFDAVEVFYNKFYFRPKPILRIIKTMVKDKDICKRRLREGWEFFNFMHNRKKYSRR
ncbi:MAG: hopanoid biosynthesis associated radical SAM protein HpnJ [Deltaproteobacteria bacterium]|nr:MAG: hopanoid biosynthesis associated radical SAM protein HpnJ [Deltaproteobacteria bacterium]